MVRLEEILRKLGCGFISTESADEFFFGSYALDCIGIDELQEGQCVEFELYDLEMGRTTITRLPCENSRSTENPDVHEI